MAGLQLGLLGLGRVDGRLEVAAAVLAVAHELLEERLVATRPGSNERQESCSADTGIILSGLQGLVPFSTNFEKAVIGRARHLRQSQNHAAARVLF